MKYKNITFISLNFHPENTAIGLYSTQLVEYLEQNGYHLDIITAFPYYPQWKIAREYQNKPKFLKEKFNGSVIYRYKQYTPSSPSFSKRIIHIIDFTVGSFFNLLKIRKCDLVISVIPFTSSSFLGSVQKRRFKAKSWVHIQDFEFDAAFQAGITNKSKKGSILYKLLMFIERKILKDADCVSTISNMMIERLKQKEISSHYYLPNWIDEDKINPKNTKKHPLTSGYKFKILYSGSIADKQDWNFFISYLKRLDFKRFEVIIVGDGSARQSLEKMLTGFNHVAIYPPVPYEELSSLLCGADLHLLFQKKEVLDTVMPSKILGMMASARPSIVTGHPQSEVKKIIKESKGGRYIDNGDIDEVLAYTEKLYTDKGFAEQVGNNAREYVVRNFGKEKILRSFVERLEQL